MVVSGSILQQERRMAGNGKNERAIEHKAYARIGLLGNPSDVYYGRTISLSLANFWASVRLQPSKDLVIVPHPTHDLVQFNSLSHMVSSSLYCFDYNSRSLTVVIIISLIIGALGVFFGTALICDL